MAHLLFINELSQAAEVHPAVGRNCFDTLANVVLRIRQILPRVALVSLEPIASLQLGQNYSMRQWMQESAATRERARLLLTLANYAPFSATTEHYGDPDPGVTEFRFAGNRAQGLGLAELYNGLPVSFCSDDCWKKPNLHLNVEQLLPQEESGAGETVLSFEIDIPHVSLEEHVEFHRSFLNGLLRRDISDAADLYSRRQELFPNLEFGPLTENQLHQLQGPALRQVFKYLSRLDEEIRKWEPNTSTKPTYPPKTTDESGSRKRKRLCYFPAWNGKVERHPLHGRYTPGAGRIFFCIKHEPKRAVIGYIGLKP